MQSKTSDGGRRSRARLAGIAGLAGGLGWAGLSLLTFAVGRGANLLGYGTLDALTPVALALAAVGLAGHRARTKGAWRRATTAGFLALFAGLSVAVVGSAVYAGAGRLGGWTVSVWAYLLALVGATVFGAGLLRDGVAPRSGAVLLAGVPVGVAVSFGLAGVVGDETLVPVGPAVFLGVGIAVLGWWVRKDSTDG